MTKKVKENIFFGIFNAKTRRHISVGNDTRLIQKYSTPKNIRLRRLVREGQVIDKSTMYKIGLQNFLKIMGKED